MLIVLLRMDKEMSNILEKLFSKSADQRSVRSLQKIIKNLSVSAQDRLVSRVAEKLKWLFQDDIVTGLSRVCLLYDGGKIIQQCLAQCMQDVLSSCICGLQVDLRNQAYVYQVSSKAVYGALQIISSEIDPFLKMQGVPEQLETLFNLLVGGVIDEDLPSDCALIVSTSMSIVFTILVRDNSPHKFLCLLKVIETEEKDCVRRKKILESLIKSYDKRIDNEISISCSDQRIFYSLSLALHGLLNSNMLWIYDVGCYELEMKPDSSEKETLCCDLEMKPDPSEKDTLSQSHAVYGGTNQLITVTGSKICTFSSPHQNLKIIQECHEESHTFLYRIYPLITKLCRTYSSSSFQAFQLLFSWLQSVRKMIKLHRKTCMHLESCKHVCVLPSQIQLFDINSGSNDSVFHILNSNWENPAKGVSDIVFRCMSELMQLHEESIPGQANVIAMHMLSTLVHAESWNSKSTYPPLSLAITHLGADVAFQKYPSIPAHLVESMTINYLAPAVTNVYKVILSQLTSSSWKKHIQSLFLEALHSSVKGLRQNLLSLWLPITIRQYPDIYIDLIDNCTAASSEGWLARMAILSITRATSDKDITTETELNMTLKLKKDKFLADEKQVDGEKDDCEICVASITQIIYHAISHIDESVRSEALAFLCQTKKGSKPVTPSDVALLKEFFSLNMNLDSAPFRQNIIKSYKALIVRLRDASASVLKSPFYKAAFVDGCFPDDSFQVLDSNSILYVNGELLLWFILRFHFNLKPCGNYQRRILSLQLYKETLLAFFEVSDTEEYIFNERFSAVSSFVNNISKTLAVHDDADMTVHPVVDLTLEWTADMLFSCCLDEMNDIRKEAENIYRILEFSRVKQSTGELSKWFHHGLSLCNSPKASDVESGASIVKIISTGKNCDVTTLLWEEGPPNPQDHWLFSLFHRVENQFKAAKENLLVAARNAPIHGSLLALGQCFCESSKNIMPLNEVELLLGKLLELMVQMVEFFLSVLAISSSKGSAVAPSFAEMGESVEMMIKKCEGAMTEEKENTIEGDEYISINPQQDVPYETNLEENFEDETAISSDHALLLSCCWQTMKVCCLVCSMCASQWLSILDESQLETILGSVIIRVLTGTRHKGAMEAARTSYSQLSTLLLGAKSKYGYLISKQIGNVLDQLKSGAQTSITRRAAGMAMMIQVACGAVPKTNRVLIDSTVVKLMDIAETVYEEQSTVDSPSVLALHILHSMVIHAPLAYHLGEHMPGVTVICLKAFASNSWALRNAALQLYGAVIPRMIGQKKVRNDSSTLNSLTASEFLSRHPKLADYLLKLLNHIRDSEETKDDKTQGGKIDVHCCDKDEEVQHCKPAMGHLSPQMHSHLVPVLSLLSRLSPGTGLQQSQELKSRLCEYYDVTLHLLVSPIHTVRRLTAISLVALTPSEQVVDRIGALINFLDNRILSANELHGKLLAIQEFFTTYPEQLHNDVLKMPLVVVLELIMKSSKCYVIATVALKILKLCNGGKQLALDTMSDSIFEPGAPYYRLTHKELEIEKYSSDELQNVLEETTLSGQNLDDDFVQFLERSLVRYRNDSVLENAEMLLLEKLENLENTRTSFIVRILGVILIQQQGFKTIPSSACVNNLMSLLNGYCGVRTTSRTLIIVAFVIKNVEDDTWGELIRKSDMMSQFCKLISAYSSASATEDYRLSASSALEICIVALLFGQTEINSTLKMQIISAIVELLQDEDSVIRDCACKIVFELQSHKLPHLKSVNERKLHHNLLIVDYIHPSLALKSFITIIVKTSFYSKDKAVLQALWRLSYLDDVCEHKSKLSLFQSQAINIYKEPKYCGLNITETFKSILSEYIDENISNNHGFNDSGFITDWIKCECEVMNNHGSLIKCHLSSDVNLITNKGLLMTVTLYVISYKALSSMCSIMDIATGLCHPINWKPGEFLELMF